MKKRNWFLITLLTCLLAIGASVPALSIARAVVLSHASLTMYVGDQETLAMEVGGSKMQPESWKSSKKSVAAISKTGVITAKKAGKATITCKTGFGYNLTCKVTVKKRVEVSKYLNKKYTKLAAKVPAAKHWNKDRDPAGIGNLYVFVDSTGSAPFFRYDRKTKKPSFVQISTLCNAKAQKGLSLYGVSFGMTEAKAKAILKKKGCSFKKKYVFSDGTGRVSLTYKKSGHSVWHQPSRNGKVIGGNT